MKTFIQPLEKMADYDKIEEQIGIAGSGVMLSGCIDSQKAHMVFGLGKAYKNRVIITYSENRARELCEDYRFFDKNVLYYPAKDFIFYNANVHGNMIIANRLQVVERLAAGEAFTVITTIDACADTLAPLASYRDAVLTVKTGDTLELEQFKKRMQVLGYSREGQVEQAGQYAVRGGIVDVFPFTGEAAYRVELWDDEIDTIKLFDVDSQRSVENVEAFTIFPATEIVCDAGDIEEGLSGIWKDCEEMAAMLKEKGHIEDSQRLRKLTQENVEAIREFHDCACIEKYVRYFVKNPVSFLEYFVTEDTLFVVDEPNRISERMSAVEKEFRDSISHRLEHGYLLRGQTDIFSGEKKILSQIAAKKHMILAALDYTPENISVNHRFLVQARSVSPYNNHVDMLVNDLLKYKKQGWSVVIVSGSRMRAERIARDFQEYDLNTFYSEKFDRELLPGEVMVTYGNLRSGFEYPMLKFSVIAETDIFGQGKTRRKKKKRYEGRSIADFNDINVGDYVVHENHGLGIYKGIEKVTVDGVEKDYIKIEYADNSNLYVNATQLERIQKYAGSEAKAPKLNKLGTQEWNKTRSRARKEIEGIAADLVNLYAQRQNLTGYSYAPDTPWQQEFEEMFPYEETDDQLNAIADVKKDMEGSKIMDRLICGDVGYGKTEIAIRAAFKAVQEGKQVVYLCPTTILAGQHFATFEQRMKDFAVRVELLSRFRTTKQIKEAVAGIKDGRVDIVIGTHRALSKDVVFKNLGLLIIDEEQRFGVRHKEAIKQLKKNVDVLTLTATPIPRTLHMSLIGIRDMSVLEEPPQDRQPIQTFVAEYDEFLVREAINRELARGGQVYYVYNRVKDIVELTSKIQALVPDAVVSYAHGQMDERKLEAVMYDFINGEIDVLVSTTIIETGLDIPNVNTMIVHDADKFGLSQLYQLRGRVGRSSRTAYAFLLYKRDRMLNEVAEKRLEAIKEFSELGSGFKIAMKDLEIRGAGNLLGKSQHGHMEAIGYDLYCKMLNQAVSHLKGIETEEEFDTVIDMNIDAYIPETYIINESHKLDIYKRIAALETEEEMSDMADELIDRFGDLPKPVVMLLKVALMKAVAHKAYVTEIKGGRNGVRITMKPDAKIDTAKIPQLVKAYNGQLKFEMGSRPFYTYVPRKRESIDIFMEDLQTLIRELASMRL
jgi:transcription-repair coupling factor (superfamily II helicase)